MIFRVGVVSGALCFLSPAIAGEAAPVKTPEGSEHAEKARQAAKPGGAAKDAQSGLSDVTRCRTEARSLDGPERSRFMTSCIKKY